MLRLILFTLVSIFHPFSLGYPECVTEFGFIPSSQGGSPNTYIYFYSGIEAQGGSSRFVFPQLTVSCYSKIDQILLFQGLPYACVKARTRYEFELWSQDRFDSNRYELVYRELLIYQQDNLTPEISLRPNSDLLMAPGDIIGFRNSTLNFYNMDNSGVPSLNVTATYTGSLPKHFACNAYSHLTLGNEVYSLGNWSPYFNFTFSPLSPNVSEFAIKFDGNESTVSSILLYHRGIYRPICDKYWHILTADTLCQSANFSHAVIAATGYTRYSEDHAGVDISSFYWLDYLYCGRFEADSSLCLRSSWECVSNCSTVNQTAATTCAREEGRTRFVLKKVSHSNHTQSLLSRLSQFSDEFKDGQIPTVQIYYSGYWQDLSADNWTTSDMKRAAQVICRSNGYTDVYLMDKFKRESATKSSIILDCTGSQSETSECKIQQQNSTDNTTSNILVLACSYSEGYVSLYNNRSHDPTRGEVRYAASNHSSSELSFICTDRWTAIESSVACNQMGYPTFFNYTLISTASSSESQYSYYEQIDHFNVIQANFSCLGDESSLKECNITQNYQSNSSSSICQRNVVNLKCATHEQILTDQAHCYDYKEILGGDYNYKFGSANSSECYFLFDLFAASENFNSDQFSALFPNLFIHSVKFGRTISIFGSYIRLHSPPTRSKRSLEEPAKPCLIVYFDSSGDAVLVAGITNRSSNTYTTLYHIDISEGISLTGNLTSLTNSLNVSSMSVICHHQDVTISRAYVISSGADPLTNITYPRILSNFHKLLEIDNAFQSLLIPSTTVPSTSVPVTSSPTNTTSQQDERIKVILSTLAGVVTILTFIVFTFLCLLLVIRRHYKREISTLQIQSKAVVSSVYNAATDLPVLDADPNNNYVQQNIYYYKLKHQSDTCALFVESTKSMRHAIRSVSIAPKFGLNMPEVDYALANSKRNRKMQDQWYIERDQLVYMRELGLGHYGKVQLMEAKNLYRCEKLPVAVKTLSTQDPVHTEQFMREIDLMVHLRNEYIVSLLGFCSPSRDASPLMVLEYLEYGDLKSLIVSYQDTPTARENELNILHLVSMAANIASAMVYLADNHLVHRDIAARNCLVGRQLMCKLSDFGLALRTDGSDSNVLPPTCITVPLKWTAPETFLSGVFSFRSDIWSYGVFLWEVFTYGCEPLDDLTKEELVFAIKEGTLVMPHIPDAPSFCNDLVQMCCFFYPDQRPGISDIQNILEGVMYKIESEESTSTSTYSESNNLVSLVETTM